MAVGNVIQSDVTYASLISSAAAALYSLISNSSVATGTYRNNALSVTIGSGATYGTNEAGKSSHAKTVTLTETENRSAAYTAPTQATITSDITTFMSGIGIPTGSTVPTSEGALSFFFALNFFIEKAIIKRSITAANGAAATYHIHYQAPSASSYTKLPYSYSMANTVTQEKITDIYNQVKTTSLLSGGVRATSISSAAHTSSSCSSSCSSSAFIAYFNLD